jgi:hypothetical protein
MQRYTFADSSPMVRPEESLLNASRRNLDAVCLQHVRELRMVLELTGFHGL